MASHEDVIREGDVPDDVHLITSGFACRYKSLPDGSRQIFAYLVPGDLCDLHVFILREMDHSIGTLSACTVVDIPRDAILRLTDRPAIARALWWATLVDEATLREWIVNMGRRRAEERVAHFLCELFARLEIVGLADENGYELPLTHADIGDTVGLSNVHVNRSLQTLRGMGLVTLRQRVIVIDDFHRLMDYAAFNPNYLHVTERDKRR